MPYSSTESNLLPKQTTSFTASQRRSSIDYNQPDPLPPPPQRRRPRPLSIAIPNHSHTALSTPSALPRPQTLTEIYAPFLTLIAQKEAQVSELRSQPTAQETELAILKRKWEKVVKHHLAFPDRERDGLTGLDSLDKIIRGIQTTATTAGAAVADAASASEASSPNPSPVFSRHSLESSSHSADTSFTSPDTSIELPASVKPTSRGVYHEPSPPRTSTTTIATSTTRRRSLAPMEKKSSISSPSELYPVQSYGAPSHKPKASLSPRQRDNGLAPLPGTALTSAAFSFIPQLSNMNLNVNLSDIKGGVDKFISPQQQKRASRVLEGIWGAVSSPSAASASVRKGMKKQREIVNLLEADADDETIMPSKSSQFSLLVPDNSSRATSRDDVDLSITASPSEYLAALSPSQSSPLDALAVGLSTPPIKEENEDSSEDGWNW